MRLFIGIKTGCEDRLVALQKQLRQMGKGNFTHSHNLHITLKFLGEISLANIGGIKEAMTEVGAPPFALEMMGAALFGKSGIVAANVGGDTAALVALHDELETALEKRGFARENRPYRPHITLARKYRANAVGDISAIKYEPCAFDVSEIVLFESKRVDGKLVYEKVFVRELR